MHAETHKWRGDYHLQNRRIERKFLRLNSLRVGFESYAVQDIDRPLTYLTIYEAPFEVPDMAIIRRLSPFCEVLHLILHLVFAMTSDIIVCRFLNPFLVFCVSEIFFFS